MKKIYLLLVLAVVFAGNTNAQVTDSVSLGAGYASDIYYSFENGEVAKRERATWHIAINTSAQSASILANAGAGVELYQHPTADTTAWATLDTMGMSSWMQLYNSDTTWEEGAFNLLATGHPDYGWGQYNSIDHNVYGHKLFVLKLEDGSYKKLWIKEKLSAAGFYNIVYDNLDNSDEQMVNIDLSQHNDKNFVHFSLLTNGVVDYEPVAADWDIVFTKYYDHDIPYLVTGVLTNYNTMAAKAYPVAPEFEDHSSLDFSSSIKTIGSDWKEFNMGTFSYDIMDSTAYFVETADGSIYKIVFTGFVGSSTGDVYFDVTAISTASVAETANGFQSIVYPNPVTDVMNLQLGQTAADLKVNIYNVLGSVVYTKHFNNTFAGEVVTLSDFNLHSGIYVVELNANGLKQQHRIIIK